MSLVSSTRHYFTPNSDTPSSVGQSNAKAVRADPSDNMSPFVAMRVGVVIATKGRPQLAARVVDELTQQTIPPNGIVIAVSDVADAPRVSGTNVTIINSRPGLTAQRNSGLQALDDATDIVVFFDDDFVPSRYWIENLCALFASAADIVGATGHVLADGSKTAGPSWDEAAQLVERADRATKRPASPVKDVLPCGCNMAFRRAAMGDLRFDERLVLYGWQEDTDFGARIARRGRCVYSDALWGVHLGTKSGRIPGYRLGYSQMVNPRYLVAKGTMRPRQALNLAGRNLAANAIRTFHPEPYIDRLGRLRGNLIGLWDIATGRWRPERAAEL
jgi:GT2 family glycosyltransferase